MNERRDRALEAVIHAQKERKTMRTRKLLTGSTLALVALTIAAGPAPVEWNVDASHSGVGFSVKHFFTPVRGQFDAYEIDLTFDRENPANSAVEVRIDVESVNTGNERRDAHLLSEDFFDVENHRWITFRSEQVRAIGPNELLASGSLTIRDVTKRVDLPIVIHGIKDIPEEMREMLGGVEHVASFEADLELDRSDYGVGSGSWAADLVVGHEVEVNVVVEANR